MIRHGRDMEHNQNKFAMELTFKRSHLILFGFVNLRLHLRVVRLHLCLNIHVSHGHLDFTQDLEAGAHALRDIIEAGSVHVAAQGLQHDAQHVG